MGFRDFDAAAAERRGEASEFVLGGKRWTAAHVNAANFLDFLRLSERPEKGFEASFELACAVVDEADREAFRQMLRESDVSILQVAELARWLVEEAVQSPLSESSDSLAGRSKTGVRSKAGRSSKGSSSTTAASAAS